MQVAVQGIELDTKTERQTQFRGGANDIPVGARAERARLSGPLRYPILLSAPVEEHPHTSLPAPTFLPETPIVRGRTLVNSSDTRAGDLGRK